MALRKSSRAGVCVSTTMPSSTGVAHAQEGRSRPATSTSHSRQLEAGFSRAAAGASMSTQPSRLSIVGPHPPRACRP